MEKIWQKYFLEFIENARALRKYAIASNLFKRYESSAKLTTFKMADLRIHYYTARLWHLFLCIVLLRMLSEIGDKLYNMSPYVYKPFAGIFC